MMVNRFPVAALSLFLCMTVFSVSCSAQVDGDQATASAVSLRTLASTALRQGQSEAALKAADALVDQDVDNPASVLLAADVYLRCGKSDSAVKWFDHFLEKSPGRLPDLWQRGIALYFTGDYKAGASQFEEHRRVNPHDVENAAWHFLCVAKADSIEKARQLLLPAPNDPRVPMEEVLAMLGNGDIDSVKRRMDSVPANTLDRDRAEFYGNFYLGLYADAEGDQAKALQLLRKAAAAAPHHYMGDVARVYVQFLERQSGDEIKGARAE